jgi:hypothetical protein
VKNIIKFICKYLNLSVYFKSICRKVKSQGEAVKEKKEERIKQKQKKSK